MSITADVFSLIRGIHMGMAISALAVVLVLANTGDPKPVAEPAGAATRFIQLRVDGMIDKDTKGRYQRFTCYPER